MEDVTPAPEEWRTLAAFEGTYEVSDLGRVRSLDRMVPTTTPDGIWCVRPVRGRILRPSRAGRGYLMVRLGRDQKAFYVHTLVAETFIGPCPPGMECCHGPGGMTDNRAANLSWGTRFKNLGPDLVRDGTDRNGDRAPMAKLTWEQIEEIRRRLPVLLPRGPRPKHLRHLPTQEQLAEEYGVETRTIGKIIAGKAWRPEFRHRTSAHQSPPSGSATA